jgi:hypothetical protein
MGGRDAGLEELLPRSPLPRLSPLSALAALGSDSSIDPVRDAPQHAQLVGLADATVSQIPDQAHSSR